MIEQFLAAYWPVIAVAGSGLVGWGALKNDVKSMKKDIAAVQADHDLLVRIDERVAALMEKLEAKVN